MGAPSIRYILENFQELDLIEPLQRAIAAENYESPSDIQALAIPAILAGRDILGCAQTGTGKTAAFSLPMLQLLSATEQARGRRQPRGLILSPTRELAAQICASIETYGKFLTLKSTVIYGDRKSTRLNSSHVRTFPTRRSSDLFWAALRQAPVKRRPSRCRCSSF